MMPQGKTHVISFNDSSSAQASRLSPTACAGCRQQKVSPSLEPQIVSRFPHTFQLRCSRHKPICTRCARRRLSCQYPAPPDRKYLAWQRNARQRTSPFPEPQDLHGQPETSDVFAITGRDDVSEGRPGRRPVPELDHHPEPERDPKSATSDAVDHTSSLPDLPAPEIGLLLIEVYFSRMFTSGLLFDRPAFMQDYHASLLPKIVLYAVFAQASL